MEEELDIFVVSFLSKIPGYPGILRGRQHVLLGIARGKYVADNLLAWLQFVCVGT